MPLKTKEDRLSGLHGRHHPGSHNPFVIGDSNLELHEIDNYEEHYGMPHEERSRRMTSSDLYDVIVHFKTSQESQDFCSWIDATDTSSCTFIFKHTMQAVQVLTTLANLNEFAKTHFGAITRAVANTPDVLSEVGATGRKTSAAQFNLDNIDVFGNDGRYSYPEHGGAGTTVYVLDSGVDCTHEEFLSPDGNEVRCKLGKSYFEGDAEGKDNNGHGTHCAGTVAGRTVGVAPQANIVSMKICDRCDQRVGKDACSHTADPSETSCRYGLRALEDIVAQQNSIPQRNRNLVVVSYSVTQTTKDAEWKEALDNANLAGVIFVHAAGNSKQVVNNAQSQHSSAITVAAAGFKSGNTVPWHATNYGKYIDIWAYGEDVWSSVPGGRYEKWSGTSMACPAVAGAVALEIGTLVRSKRILLRPKNALFSFASQDKIKNLASVPGTTNKFLRIYNYGVAGTYYYPKEGPVQSKVVIVNPSMSAPSLLRPLQYSFFENVNGGPRYCSLTYSSSQTQSFVSDPAVSDPFRLFHEECAVELINSAIQTISFDFGTKRLSGNALSVVAQNGKVYYRKCKEANEECNNPSSCKLQCCNERAQKKQVCSDPQGRNCVWQWQCSDTCEAFGWECPASNENLCKDKCCSGNVKSVFNGVRNVYKCVDGSAGVG